MILLDKPLVSDFVKDSIRQKKFAALDTGNLLENGALETLTDEEVIDAFKLNPSQRLHTISENAIGWIEENLGFTQLPEKIRIFKDKFLFRELTKDLFPKLFYVKYELGDLDKIDTGTLPFPLIIKPNIGFFSMGVHKVFSKAGWKETIEKIKLEAKDMQDVYPGAVLNTASFIIEECIEGDEYALDAYYDEVGLPVVTGMMKHLFGGADDVSDRVYQTSAAIVDENLVSFNSLLEEIGSRAALKNFSLHLELRVDQEGNAVPIEVNPLRFGAWCTSADLMHYAYGFNPYEYYIKGLNPDWDDIIKNSTQDIYSIIILDNSTGTPAEKIKSFDYDKILLDLGDVLELRKIDYHQYPIFGILFTRTAPKDYSMIEKILHDDLRKYIRV